MGSVEPKKHENGVSSWGEFPTSQGPIEVISYNEWYFKPILSATGQIQYDAEGEVIGENIPLLPKGVVILASTQARSAFHYGLIQNMHCLKPAHEFIHIWTESSGKARWIQYEKAPMPNLYEPGAYIVAHVK
jgi:hypothetical protein